MSGTPTQDRFRRWRMRRQWNRYRKAPAMVELLKLSQTRPEKIRTDLLNLLRLFRAGRTDLIAAGTWQGATARTRIMDLCNWYWCRTDCRTCRETPHLSFSGRVCAATERRGAAVGVIVGAGLLAARTIRREPAPTLAR